MRARASEFEMEEKWTDAQREYEAMLTIDPTLGFAREGRARAEERVQLASRLQRLIDDPQSVAEDRAGAIQLIDRARQQQPYGPLLRSQVARLQTLMTGSYEPVRLTGSHQLPPAAEFYPSGARERREQGVVNVRVCVDASGVIQGTPTVQRSSGFGELDAAAIDLAGAGHYAVSMRGGVAVPNCHRIDVVFALSD
jgi:TonB family protein